MIVVAGRGARARPAWLCAGNWRKPWEASCLYPSHGGKWLGGYGPSDRPFGRTVRPKLIITCGVSGAIQFTSCMNSSDCIVAINENPEAQIFKIAHYCLVDDLYQVVPRLTELLKNRKED